MTSLPTPRFLQPEEFALSDLLIDDLMSDPWAIDDLIEAHGLTTVPVFLDHIGLLTGPLQRAIADINSAAEANPHIFPAPLLRPPRFPRIRQMRDVHQFDVGSHLAFCHALACRDAAPRLVEQHGLSHLAAHLFAARDGDYRTELSVSAIFHDLYKSLRPRRRLPDKGTDVSSLIWRLPNGLSHLDNGADDENFVGGIAIAIYWPGDTNRMSKAIELSGMIGAAVYQEAKAVNLSDGNWDETLLNAAALPENALGLELAIIDWLGKGWAADIIAVRKQAQRSHSQAVIAFLNTLQRAL